MYRFAEDFLDVRPHLRKEWSDQNPLGRLGRPDELRGAALWLASDASTFCTGSEYVLLSPIPRRPADTPLPR